MIKRDISLYMYYVMLWLVTFHVLNFAANGADVEEEDDGVEWEEG